MGILDGAFERRSTEVTYSLRDPALINLFGGPESVSGAHITPENSLRVSGWYAGVNLIATSVAKMPFITYKRIGEGKERALSHPVFRVLRRKPNAWMTPFEFFTASQAHLVIRGNAFSMIERNGAGSVVALWPMHPSRVRLQVVPEQGRIWYYHYPENGSEQQLAMEDVLHIRGLSSDGILGYCPVDLAREVLGLAKAEEEYRARFFRNDARPGAIVEYPGKMSDEAYNRFKKDWQDTYAGLGNKHKVGFLEAGLKWHDVGFPPEAAEFIAGRQFQLEEVARILGVPLVMLQSTEKNTSWGTGVHEVKQIFLDNCLMNYLIAWEQRVLISLFTESEQDQFKAEFETKNYLRADPKAEAEILQIMLRSGSLSPNEWRAIVNMNAIKGDFGDKYIIEGNMTTLEKVGEEPEVDEPDTPAPAMNGNGNGVARYTNGQAK